VLYVETSGELGALAGGCDAPRRYDRDVDDVVQVELTLRDPDGDEVELADADDISYDVDGFVGVALHEVDIDTTGDHVLTVAATDGDAFAIAVGRSPDQGVALLRWAAVAAAIGALVIGGVLLVLGSRRPAPTVARPDPWTPDGRGWPSSPPGFPVPPPTTGATGPAGPPLTAPPATPSATPSTTPSATPLTTPGDRPPASPAVLRPPSPSDDDRSPWAPPSPR
jgi:hypothetical protein